MLRTSNCLHCLHHLLLLLWASLNHKWLELFHVCSLEVCLNWLHHATLEWSHSLIELWWLLWLYHFIHAFQFFAGFCCEHLSIAGIALESKLVMRVLWMLLMVDVLGTVLPMGELCFISRVANDGSCVLLNYLRLLTSRLSSEELIHGFIKSGSVHAVRVQDLMFFLRIEGILRW